MWSKPQVIRGVCAATIVVIGLGLSPQAPADCAEKCWLFERGSLVLVSVTVDGVVDDGLAAQLAATTLKIRNEFPQGQEHGPVSLRATEASTTTVERWDLEGGQ